MSSSTWTSLLLYTRDAFSEFWHVFWIWFYLDFLFNTENTFKTNWFSGFWHLILRMGYISKDYFSSAFVHLLKVIGLRLCIISGINLNCHSLYIYMHVHIYTCIHTSNIWLLPLCRYETMSQSAIGFLGTLNSSLSKAVDMYILMMYFKNV